MKLPSTQTIPVILIGLLGFCVAAAAQAQEPDQPSTKELAEKIESLLNQAHELKQRLDQQVTAQHQTQAQVGTAGTQAASAKGESWPHRSISYLIALGSGKGGSRTDPSCAVNERFRPPMTVTETVPDDSSATFVIM
jgi:hypothetical protein